MKTMKTYETIPFINSEHNKELIQAGISVGVANGYVAVPFGHPLHGKSCEELSRILPVHGGITCTCKLPLAHALMLDEMKTPSDIINVANCPFSTQAFTAWWVIGFDTCHAGDTSKEWTVRRVKKETLWL